MKRAKLDPGRIAVGEALPAFELNVTSTVIVAGAIASRDFMPAHHDPVFARAKGIPWDTYQNELQPQFKTLMDVIRRDPGAVFGLLVFLAIVAMAVFAPVL